MVRVAGEDWMLKRETLLDTKRSRWKDLQCRTRASVVGKLQVEATGDPVAIAV